MNLSALPAGLVRILCECGIIAICTSSGSFIFGAMGGAVGAVGGGIVAAIRTSGIGSSLVSSAFWSRLMPWLRPSVISVLVMFCQLISRLNIRNIWDYVCSAFETLSIMAQRISRAITGGSHDEPRAILRS